MKSLDGKTCLILFDKGRKLFNQGKIHDAHVVLEEIWKHGNNKIRKNIKGFIQLSGALLNQSQGKQRAVEYLMEKAKYNIIECEMFLNEMTIKNIVKQINEFNVSTKYEIYCDTSMMIRL